MRGRWESRAASVGLRARWQRWICVCLPRYRRGQGRGAWGAAGRGGGCGDRERAAAQVLQGGDVARPEGRGEAGRGAVLVPPHAPRDAREQLHQAQAEDRVPGIAGVVDHVPPLTRTPPFYMVRITKLFR